MSLILVLLLVALVFEYINGFHDTANAIATSVGTKVSLRLRLWPSPPFFTYWGRRQALAVAKTISSGLVDANLSPSQNPCCPPCR